jgi:prepilin-type N-terminal cleavage/methylation domain-containing protein
MRNARAGRIGFSVIELVIVMVILGIIAAIAIPRMSRGSQGAAENALAGDLAVWRSALDLYQSEHGGAYPKDNSTIVAQLTQYTDSSGAPAAVKDSVHIYGPYMRAVLPLPVGEMDKALSIPRGSTTVGPATLGGAPSTITSGGFGWVYDGAGNLYPNTGPLTDVGGKLYNSY